MIRERGDQAERREQTMQRIIGAAGRVIDQKGYAAASTPEIQDLAGISRGGLYHYYESKQALGDAILARQHNYFEDSSEEIAAGPPPELWLQALIDVSHHYTAAILDDPVLRAAIRLSIEPGPYQSADSYAGSLAAVTSLLESAHDAGELQDTVDPAEAARTLVGCYSGVQLLSLALEERDGLHQQVEAMWVLLMPGLARQDVVKKLRLAAPPAGAGPRQ